MTEFAATAGNPGRPVAAAPIYRDRHETSLPLLLLGIVVTASAAIQVVTGLDSITADWPTSVVLTIVFTALWLTFRRRATARGMNRPSGFGIAAIIGLVAVLPPFFVTIIYAGPFLVFSLGLAAAGLRVRNRLLAGWGLVVGGIGVFEGFFGISNRIGLAFWATWEHPGIYLLLGTLTVIAGILTLVRENDLD